MITAKELQYVDLWASKIPMPGIEYSSNVMKEIEECYHIYKKIYLDKEYDFIFSNGEEIGFEISSKNLCHMLGIDYNNIKQDCFDNYRKNVLGTNTNDFTSFDLLEMLIANQDKVIEHDNNIKNKLKAINYYKSSIKCAIFRKLSDFDKFNFAAINYNPGDDKFEYDKQKTFFMPSNESVCPYFMVGIKIPEETEKKENEIPKYIITTLFAPQNPIEYFNNQEVIIPTQILISDNSELTRLNASPSKKIQLLTMYKNIINTYNIPNRINIYGDYESILNQQNNEKRLTRILK